MEDEVDNAIDMVEQEESTGSTPSPLFSGTKPKRLRSKVWDDFTPIFIDGKVTKAECMHCHQVFSSSSSSGTSNLLKHQTKCSPRAQKRPTQQKLPFLPSTQKSMVAAGSDPTQKKLSFLPTSQKKCLGTADAIHKKKDLALTDIPKYTNWKSQDVDQNGSNKELATPEQKDLVLPDISTDTNRKSQEVDQNGPHEELTIPEQKNLALPDIPIDKNTKNQSYEELALPEQDIPTDTSHKNQVVDQNGTHDELVRILAMHGYLPSMMHHGGFRKSVAFLNPMVKMPPYADLMCKCNLLDLFDKEKAKLNEKFAALRSWVCLSAYVWHYDPLSPFLCLSVHYIDDEWERPQNIIRFHSMDPSCSAEELSDVILTAIGDWGLHGKVFSITLDDAFIDDSVASNAKAHLQKWNSPCANWSLFVDLKTRRIFTSIKHKICKTLLPITKELEEKRKEKAKVAYERRKQQARLRVKAEKASKDKLGSQMEILAPIKY